MVATPHPEQREHQLARVQVVLARFQQRVAEQLLVLRLRVEGGQSLGGIDGHVELAVADGRVHLIGGGHAGGRG